MKASPIAKACNFKQLYENSQMGIQHKLIQRLMKLKGHKKNHLYF